MNDERMSPDCNVLVLHATENLYIMHLLHSKVFIMYEYEYEYLLLRKICIMFLLLRRKVFIMYLWHMKLCKTKLCYGKSVTISFF